MPLCRLAGAGALTLLLLSSTVYAQSSTATGVSRAANPALSANVLYLVGKATRHDALDEPDERHAADADEHGAESPGARVQEFELRMTSFVDPHVKADLTLATHGVSETELEEAFVTTVGLPSNLALKAGKFLGSFGKHNPLHTHRYPFIERPMAHETLFGEEGLNEVGAEVSWLAPTDWYTEIVAGVYNGDNPALFSGEAEEDVAFLGRVRSLVDLNDATTFEVGASGLTGRHEELSARSNVVGADATLKWLPLEAQRHKALTLQIEYLRGDVGGATRHGGQVVARVRVTRRWWVQGSGDWLAGDDPTVRRVRGLIAYVPTEFQALRLQYGATFSGDEDTDHRVALQYNFTIGSHPAHAY
ncbi:hypothetical protein CMK11_02465 [Candidatus Poribacteria bacterium]|nr:hypothetical protein [Candidatus Poribacteria bacterium]